MEIQSLRLTVTEEDLNALAKQHVPKDQPIEDLKIALAADGIHVTGQYEFFFNVHFETIWQVGVKDGLAFARLAHFTAMGIPGNIFKSAVMKEIEGVAKSEPWIRVKGDEIFADLEQAAAKFAIPMRLRLKAVTAQAGTLQIEAGD
jgi:hypothetical protein